MREDVARPRPDDLNMAKAESNEQMVLSKGLILGLKVVLA